MECHHLPTKDWHTPVKISVCVLHVLCLFVVAPVGVPTWLRSIGTLFAKQRMSSWLSIAAPLSAIMPTVLKVFLLIRNEALFLCRGLDIGTACVVSVSSGKPMGANLGNGQCLGLPSVMSDSVSFLSCISPAQLCCNISLLMCHSLVPCVQYAEHDFVMT